MSDETGKKLNKKRLAKVQDYQRFFTTEYGRRVLHDLFNAHGMLTTNFHENPYVMAAREGERAVIVRILSILKTSPEKLYKQIEESDKYVNQDII